MMKHRLTCLSFDLSSYTFYFFFFFFNDTATTEIYTLSLHDALPILRGTIFGKPANPEEAAEMLRQLEGRKHQVMTAVAVALGGRGGHALDVTDVTFRPLTDAPIAADDATRGPPVQAGAYPAHGHGPAPV